MKVGFSCEGKSLLLQLMYHFPLLFAFIPNNRSKLQGESFGFTLPTAVRDLLSDTVAAYR